MTQELTPQLELSVFQTKGGNMICETPKLGEEVLDELRQANPVDADALPSSRSPEPVARLEEMLESIDGAPPSGRTRMT